jgi:hypothetical protein
MGHNGALSSEEWRECVSPLRVHSTNLLNRCLFEIIMFKSGQPNSFACATDSLHFVGVGLSVIGETMDNCASIANLRCPANAFR